MNRNPCILALVLCSLFARPCPADEPARKTENVILVMLDGLRWQEVFAGAEESLIDKERGGVADVAAVRREFVRPTVEEQRAALLPFLWGTVAKQGQLFGSQSKNSVARVVNEQHFSYPGYSEVLCGFVDPAIDSNDKIPNRNVTVLEWLHKKPEFEGKIAAFTSWDVFPYILNTERSKILVNSGPMPLTAAGDTPDIRLLNRLIREAPPFGEETRPDALTFHAARLYLAARKPRVLFVSFDETDAFAHAGRYDRVLGSARKGDAFVRELWELVQSLPEYKDKTTLIVTTDHGRGFSPVEWKNHNTKTAGSAFIWVGILGPDTPPLGERRDIEPVTQSQVAATLAAALGYDFPAASPRSASPIREAFTGQR